MEAVQDAASVTTNGAASANSPPPFLSKTYDMVDDPSTDPIVSWSRGNNSFVVWNVPEFSRDLLPKYFKHNNFSSFVRQLNTYGFRKVDPDRFEFANEGFLRGQKHLLKSISRRRPANVQNNQQPPQVQGSSFGACVEVGKFGLDEEVERLKRDKNVLMQELVRLRQQQQATDNQLQNVGQRVQVMEQRQQQMMSFLAKAMQSPGFFSQFVKQQNDTNRRIGEVNKKRRLPREEEENSSVCHKLNARGGQIVKYQPSMNEAAKAMLRQILKMNASGHEQSLTNNEAFLIDHLPSSSALESRSSSNRTSGVTLAEVLPTPGQSKSSADSGICIGHLPQVPDSQSSSYAVEHVNTHQTQEIHVPVPQDNADIPDANFLVSEIASPGYLETLSAALDDTMDVESDAFSPEQDAEIMLDDVTKLPAISDVFWEQFLAASPLAADTEEISSTSHETGITNDQESHAKLENGFEKAHYMDHLTKQMGHLTSDNGTA
ncbi:hypothetical protein BT93_A2417 [Corymbia citriodora subsp. variegata]|nr:hypothetical protein BT93_A2417 [Corymbia citriodora subsp. variegata]KAF8044420.1 hypothetical protein BT93_A2417 [Corymbia citriodora subsp. variegata]